ncbi:MAG: polyprenyl diphosphate synthase, partial [Candidatus Izemoplasmatales bacterium]
MKKIKKIENLKIPNHIAIILDGNGRWAKKRHMPRTYGHQRGVENIKTIAIAASNLGIKALSVYAFSTENWSRPKDEVDFLMKLPGEFEKRFKDDFKKYDIKVMFSGRKTHLSSENLVILERITENTKDRKGLILNICFDYGSRAELTEAVKEFTKDVLNGSITIEDITEAQIE